jgi:hypothetical protein
MKKTISSSILFIGLVALGVVLSCTACEAGEATGPVDAEAKRSRYAYVASLAKVPWQKAEGLVEQVRSKVTVKHMVEICALGLGAYELYYLRNKLSLDSTVATYGDYIATFLGVGSAVVADGIGYYVKEKFKEKCGLNPDVADILYIAYGLTCGTTLLRCTGVSLPRGPLTRVQRCALSASPLLALIPPVKCFAEEVSESCIGGQASSDIDSKGR